MTTKPNPSCLHCRIHETIRQFREDVAKSGQDLPLDTAAALLDRLTDEVMVGRSDAQEAADLLLAELTP